MGRLILAGALALAILVSGVIVAMVSRPRGPSRPDVSGVELPVDLPRFTEETTGARYTMTEKQVRQTFQKVKKEMLAFHDNLAVVEANRLLLSNASVPVKERARLLKSHAVRPSFTTVRDPFPYAVVLKEPPLYDGCAVVWRGKLANLSMGERSISFDLLVGYESEKELAGHRPRGSRFPGRAGERDPPGSAGHGLFRGQQAFAARGVRAPALQPAGIAVRAVVQRVRDCTVRVGERVTGKIASGLLVYLGIGRNDTAADVKPMCDKILALRIFPDENGKMNLSVRDTGGAVLVVSQFTLYGDVRDGRRPSYTSAAEPQKARELYEAALAAIAAAGMTVAAGEFAASMEVSYTNLGPVTDPGGLGEEVLIPTVAEFRRRIRAHYRVSARDLPWRRSRTPYRVLVSEIMLQQTGVERVRAAYPAFLARFPSVRALAGAQVREVLAAWKGLGYNRRALHLKQAAEAIVERHGGRVRRSMEHLTALPGVGRATACRCARVRMRPARRVPSRRTSAGSISTSSFQGAAVSATARSCRLSSARWTGRIPATGMMR